MKIITNKEEIMKFQQGGAAPVPAQQAPAADPMEQIVALAQQLLQELGPEACMALVQVLAEMLQGGAQQAPAEEVAYQKCGGKLKKVKKAKCGSQLGKCGVKIKK